MGYRGTEGTAGPSLLEAHTQPCPTLLHPDGLWKELAASGPSGQASVQRKGRKRVTDVLQ